MIEQLRQLMTLDANMDSTGIEVRFEQIAKMLFENFAIQKGETKYLFKEIEFYFYNKNHRDIITHPRASKPLYWYVNDFGIAAVTGSVWNLVPIGFAGWVGAVYCILVGVAQTEV